MIFKRLGLATFHWEGARYNYQFPGLVITLSVFKITFYQNKVLDLQKLAVSNINLISLWSVFFCRDLNATSNLKNASKGNEEAEEEWGPQVSASY